MYDYSDQSLTAATATGTIGGTSIVFPSGSNSSTPSGALSSIAQQVIIGVLVVVMTGIVVHHMKKKG